MAAQDLRRRALTERVGSFIASAFFKTFHAAGKDVSTTSLAYGVATAVAVLQFLALPMSLLTDKGSVGLAVAQVLQAVALLRMDELLGPTGFLVLVVIVTSVAAVTWITLITTAVMYQMDRNVPTGLVTGVRLFSSIGSIVLSFPLLNVAMRGAACNGQQSTFGTDCYGLGHIGLANACILLWVLTLPTFMLCDVVFLDRNPLSASLAAKAHGRLEAGLLFSKGLLSVMFNAFTLEGTNWFTIIVTAVIIAGWVVGYVRLAPMIHPVMNDIMVACGVSLGWAMVGVVLERLATNQSLTVMVLIGIPLAFIFALYVARYRRIGVCRLSLQDLDSLYDMDLWARSRLRLFEEMESSSNAIDRNWTGDNATGKHGSAEAASTGLASTVARSIGASGAGGARGAAVHLASQVIIRLGSSYAEDDRMTAVLAAEVELAYQSMMDKFPSSSLAHLLAATYFRLAHPSRYMELHALNMARKSNAPIDVSFFIYQRTRDLIDADTSYLPSGELRSGVAGTKAITPVDRMAYEGRLLGAFNSQTACYRALLRVWDALQEPVPDLAELQRMGEVLWHNLDEAEGHFKVLLTMNPEGVSVLRAYAAFQRTLMHNATTAYELEARADALADATAATAQGLVSRFALMGKAPDLGFMEEGVAMITISTEVSRVGEILGVNSAACRLLLRNRSDLVGSNISVIMPKPLSTVHDQFLHRYTRTGAARLIGSTHQVLIQQATGFIQPCRMHMREAAPTMSDTSPRISAVLQLMGVGEHMIMFGSEDEEFQIYSADAASHELMGTDPELLEDIGASIITYFPAVHPGYVNLDELDLDAPDSARSDESRGNPNGAAGNHSLLYASTFMRTPVRVDEGGMGMDDFGGMGPEDSPTGGRGFSGDFDDEGPKHHVMAVVQTLNMPSLGGAVYLLQWRRTAEDLAAEAEAAAADARADSATMGSPLHRSLGPPPMVLELAESPSLSMDSQRGGRGSSQPSFGSGREHKVGPSVASPVDNPGVGLGMESKAAGGLGLIPRPAPITVPRPPAGASRVVASKPPAGKASAAALAPGKASEADSAAAGAASRMTAHSMLVRKVIEAQRLMTDSSILNMRRILYGLFLIVFLLAIILLAVLPEGRQEITRHIASLYQGGRRSILARQVNTHARVMETMANLVRTGQVGRAARSFAREQALLSTLTDELDAVKESLNADIQQLGMSQEAFEDTRSITRLSAGGTETQMNPSEATEDLLSSLHVLRYLTPDEVVTSTGVSPYLEEVKVNAGTLAAAFTRSVQLKVADAAGYVSNLGLLEIAGMTAVFVLVFLTIVVAFTLLVGQLASKREAALSVFLQVPPAAVKHMRDSTAVLMTAHMKRVAQETAGDVEGGDVGEEEDDMVGAGLTGEAALRAGLAGRSRRSSAAGAAAQDVSAAAAEASKWDGFFQVKARSKAAKRLGLGSDDAAPPGPGAVGNLATSTRTLRRQGTMVTLRRGTDSANWRSWSVCKVQAPVASLMLWLGLVCAMDLLAQSEVQQEAQRIFVLQATTATFSDMLSGTRELMAAAPSIPRADTVGNLTVQEQDILQGMQALLSGTQFLTVPELQGSPTLQPLPSTRDEFGVMLQDGCVGLSVADQCKAFAAGVVGSGLVPGVHGFLSMVRRVVGATGVAAFQTNRTATLASSNIFSDNALATEYEVGYFREAFNALAVSFRESSLAAQVSFGSVELALTITFLVIFLLLVAPSYLQLVTSLGRTVKASRILLTAFPEPLMSRMPPVQKEVQSIAHQFTSSHFMTAAAGSGIDSALASVLGKGVGMGGGGGTRGSESSS